MGDSFYEYLYKMNPENGASNTNKEDAIVEDEAIVSPWTHKFTIYCASPSKTFLEELKSKDGVVAVYVKEKDKTINSDKEASPSNK